MIKLPYAEVIWALNSHCSLQCSYCRPEWKGGDNNRTIEQYLDIVDKLQRTRYQHHQKIYWTITGGEPLDFPELGTLLKKIKEKPATVCLETSGDITWFSYHRIATLVDKVHLTYHEWQNDDVFEFILDQCKENNTEAVITVPLIPNQIYESRAKVEHFKQLGYTSNEQILQELDGTLYRGYTQIDENRIHGVPDEFIPDPVVYDPNLPDPNHIDLTIINDHDPIYTGKPCYAGVDWIYINHRGFATYSQCGGRNEDLNAFNPQWVPPSSSFSCTVNQCRHESDRNKIRIVSN